MSEATRLSSRGGWAVPPPRRPRVSFPPPTPASGSLRCRRRPAQWPALAVPAAGATSPARLSPHHLHVTGGVGNRCRLPTPGAAWVPMAEPLPAAALRPGTRRPLSRGARLLQEGPARSRRPVEAWWGEQTPPLHPAAPALVPWASVCSRSAGAPHLHASLHHPLPSRTGARGVSVTPVLPRASAPPLRGCVRAPVTVLVPGAHGDHVSATHTSPRPGPQPGTRSSVHRMRGAGRQHRGRVCDAKHTCSHDGKTRL